MGGGPRLICQDGRDAVRKNHEALDQAASDGRSHAVPGADQGDAGSAAHFTTGWQCGLLLVARISLTQ